MANLERAYAADIKTRMADEKYPAEGIKVVADEFTAGGIVYEKEGVRVTAFEVDHGDKSSRLMATASTSRDAR